MSPHNVNPHRRQFLYHNKLTSYNYNCQIQKCLPNAGSSEDAFYVKFGTDDVTDINFLQMLVNLRMTLLKVPKFRGGILLFFGINGFSSIAYFASVV